MVRVLPLDEDANRTAMAQSVLRRIRRRQKGLRRRWHELSRDEVLAELLAIGQDLVKAAPLFLPFTFESGGKSTGSGNGKVPSRNAGYGGGRASRRRPGWDDVPRPDGGIRWDGALSDRPGAKGHRPDQRTAGGMGECREMHP